MENNDFLTLYVHLYVSSPDLFAPDFPTFNLVYVWFGDWKIADKNFIFQSSKSVSFICSFYFVVAVVVQNESFSFYKYGAE